MSNGDRIGAGEGESDPTALTTDQLLREIDRLEKLMDSKVAGARELTDEKFAAIKERFVLLENLRKEQKADARTEVQAALMAAKEAVHLQKIASDEAINKSERTTSEQLRQTLPDLKDRVTALEAVKLGAKENTAAIYATVGLLVTLCLLAFGAVTFFANR